jgi:large subunit ribosomal protein L13
MKTKFFRKDDVQRDWRVVDANDRILGKLAVAIAVRLTGKNKPIYTPNSDTGEFIVVINAEKIKFTGGKETKKIYYSHSNYPGGLKAESLKHRLIRKPEQIIKDAVWGMLPKNRLGRKMIKKLKVYKGPEHPHAAQKPEMLTTL